MLASHRGEPDSIPSDKVRFLTDELALGLTFFRVLVFPPANHHPTIRPYSSTIAPRGVR
jgi:hypothetical protein